MHCFHLSIYIEYFRRIIFIASQLVRERRPTPYSHLVSRFCNPKLNGMLLRYTLSKLEWLLRHRFTCERKLNILKCPPDALVHASSTDVLQNYNDEIGIIYLGGWNNKGLSLLLAQSPIVTPFQRRLKNRNPECIEIIWYPNCASYTILPIVYEALQVKFIFSLVYPVV